jgi:hypothetical protein
MIPSLQNADMLTKFSALLARSAHQVPANVSTVVWLLAMAPVLISLLTITTVENVAML